MKIIMPFVFSLLTMYASSSFAQLEAYKDYAIGEKVHSMTTIKVAPNLMDDYLEGIRETWVAGNDVSKELGQLEDYSIYMSELADSGDFNLVLVVTYKDATDAGPNEAAFKAFMKAWGRKMQEKTREITKNYPAMREITGEYRLREITMK